MRKMKNILKTFFLLAVLVFSLNMVAFAETSEETSEEVTITAQGTCGTGVEWTLDSAGTLTVSGEGRISNYSASINTNGTIWSNAPWANYREEIQAIIIESGITYIGNYAFIDCRNASNELVIPSTVTEIGYGSFYKCGSLKGDIVIPEGVTRLEEEVFYYCKNLTSIELPSSLTYVGKSAFMGCQSMSGELVLPSNLKRIEEAAFRGCKALTGDLIIPEGVTEIGPQAFYGCSGFNGTLSIPSTITTIPDQTFEGCKALSGSLVIPSNITSIGMQAFRNCSGFKGGLTLSPNASIGKKAFQSCSGLSGDLVIPEGITTIADGAFYGCSGLKGTLSIPSTLTYIPQNMCYGCSGLSGTLEIPSSITSIGKRAFYNCKGFTGELVIPDTVTTISASDDGIVGYVFQNCTGFTKLTLSKNLTEIPQYAFDGCTGLRGSLTIPSKVAKIGANAFKNCKGFIGGLVIPDTVTTMGNYAFQNCTGFNKLTLSKNLTVIPQLVFDGCTGFKGELVIPEGVTEIKSQAFRSCKGFTGDLEIPDTVTTIGKNTFYGCDNVKCIYIYNKECTFANTDNKAFSTNSLICGYPGSTTETYASTYGFDFRSIELKFSGVAIALYDNLRIKFSVDESVFTELGYTDPYVVFSFNGTDTTITDYVQTEQGYIFTFSNIASNRLNDTVTATLYAKYNGEEYSGVGIDYSIADYCYNMLALCGDNRYAELRTLLVDLLEYGTASQKYTNYKTDQLVNAKLTDAQKAWGTKADRTYVNSLNSKHVVIDNPIVKWSAVTLDLKDAITMRFVIAADEIDGLYVEVKQESGKTWTIPSSKFNTVNGGYSFDFNGLNASNLSDKFYFTVCNADATLSNTLCYSVESYAYAQQNNSDANLAALVKAMMRYGDSAYNYVN